MRRKAATATAGEVNFSTVRRSPADGRCSQCLSDSRSRPENAHQHQAPGGAEKTADHRERNESDGRPRCAKPSLKRRRPVKIGAQRQRDERRRQQLPSLALRQAASRGATSAAMTAQVAPSGPPIAMAANCARGCGTADGAGDESRRETVRKPRRNRSGKYQRRVGDVKQYGENTDHRAQR